MPNPINVAVASMSNAFLQKDTRNLPFIKAFIRNFTNLTYMSQNRCCSIVWNNTRKVIETLDRLANMNQNPIAKKRLQIFPKAKMTSNKNAHTFWQYFLAQFFVPFHMVWSVRNPPKNWAYFFGAETPISQKVKQPKKGQTLEGWRRGTFEFYRNEPPLQLCRVLRSPSDRGPKK